MTKSPMEAALSALAGRDVEACLRPVPAEYRFECEGSRDAALEVAALPGVARAVAVPPRVFASPETAYLREVVPTAILAGPAYGRTVLEPRFYIVSFSGPNVNKPLHLGHFRNNVIGMAVSTMLADQGHTVERQAPHCNWGIHIAQALLAWRRWHRGEPDSKGDHFVGRHYVLFHERLAEDPSLELEAAALMQAMEDGDEALREENRRFAGWADQGIRETYDRIGTRMDAIFYDQDHLDAGKRIVADALAAGQCHRRDDSSVYVDLTGHGLGLVTLERRDGTPTVYRQWMAVNVARYPTRPFDEINVVTGKEWEAGIGILRETLRAFGHEWAARMHAVHYGLVTLPGGRMKSRSGTGVGTDGVLDALRDELGGDETAEAMGLGLLKHHFLAVRRSRDVVYDEAALRGAARERFVAVVRAVAWADGVVEGAKTVLDEASLRALLLHLDAFPGVVARATAEREPAHVVRHLDETARLAANLAGVLPPGDELRAATGVVLRRALALLNIDLPERLDLALHRHDRGELVCT